MVDKTTSNFDQRKQMLEDRIKISAVILQSKQN